jgi:hypothetical protein
MTITNLLVSGLFTLYEKELLSTYLYSKSPKILNNRRVGAQAGIRTRVLRATAVHTRPNYTTWAIKRRNTYTIIQLIKLSRDFD